MSQNNFAVGSDIHKEHVTGKFLQSAYVRTGDDIPANIGGYRRNAIQLRSFRLQTDLSGEASLRPLQHRNKRGFSKRHCIRTQKHVHHGAVPADCNSPNAFREKFLPPAHSLNQTIQISHDSVLQFFPPEFRMILLIADSAQYVQTELLLIVYGCRRVCRFPRFQMNQTAHHRGSADVRCNAVFIGFRRIFRTFRCPFRNMSLCQNGIFLFSGEGFHLQILPDSHHAGQADSLPLLFRCQKHLLRFRKFGLRSVRNPNLALAAHPSPATGVVQLVPAAHQQCHKVQAGSAL